MRFDFSDESYFDNHTHLLYTDLLSVAPDEFAINYYHGIRDEISADGSTRVSKEAIQHLHYQGVIMMLVNAMSQKFGCAPTIEGATELRNSLTKTHNELKNYTKMLFDDENICGVMLDAEHPMNEPIGECFPCKVFRLFRYEDVFFSLLKTETSFDLLLEKFLAQVCQAHADGFAGLKGHIGEKCGFNVREVSRNEAQQALPLAANGNKEALRTVYYAMFSELLELAGKLSFPIHLHTGTTGFKLYTDVYGLDPILMAPFLNNPRYAKATVVLLHGSFPFTRNAAWMAYNFPNVYLDLSQTQLWQGVLLDRLLEDALSCVPHDKIMCGTGQHWYCEMVWLAAKIAKRSLAEVMERLVDGNYFSAAQAEKSARMILHENAERLYEGK